MTSLALNDLGLRPAERKAIERKAKHAGKTASEYVRSLIARDLLSDKTFDEILEPVRKDFRQQATTEDELAAIVRRARKTNGAKIRRTRP
ncbi:MAG TPA: hypothetical protein VM008_11495 [Phycisphaerae bacterium]|nr:hypothetical protein [Phycisphaerae bacterium]